MESINCSLVSVKYCVLILFFNFTYSKTITTYSDFKPACNLLHLPVTNGFQYFT